MVDLLKTFLSRDVENKIDEYLKLKNTTFLSELNLDLNSNYISLKSYSLDDLKELRSIWLEVANISVKIYTEYEFFRQFSFPNRYKSQIYEKRLKYLGYKQDKGIWIIDQIPNKQCIVENIFYSYIYNFLYQEKMQELNYEKFMKENAENSIKFENLYKVSIDNDTSVTNVSDEQLTPENIDHVAIPPNREMGKSNEVIGSCIYCDNEILGGICKICETKPNQSITNLQKINKNEEKCPVTMRSNSPKTSRNSQIKSNLTSQWACNVYIVSQNRNRNCEVCMSNKSAKINSCVFESSNEVSNENKIDNEEHVGNICIEIDTNAKSVENADKWACTKCTFKNEITDNLCVVCLEPNICAIDDYELPEETWCCKKCRENNLFECYRCKICRSPAEFFNKWRCEQCSFYNDKVAKRCEVCEIGNPYLVKCNLCSKNLVNKKYDKICKQCTIFAEKCTNKQTIDYQDCRETQSGMSEYREVSDKRIQRRENINEKQKNLKNEVPQISETKGKDRIVDKINNKQTGNKNDVNKTLSETFRYNSLSNFDENSGKRNENKTQDKNNDEKNCKFSNVGISSNYEKTDNFTAYKLPPGTFGSNKSLPKGDRNSGKLIENKINSNKDIQQKIGTKEKMNLKPCKNCKSKMCANNQYWCTKCENLQWFCQNEGCDGINYQNEYCKQCKAKNGSNFSDCNNFWVMRDDGKECQMWQCGFCLQFNAGTLNKCIKCKNHRDLACYKKCKCNWNNLNIREKCDKCNADLIKR